MNRLRCVRISIIAALVVPAIVPASTYAAAPVYVTCPDALMTFFPDEGFGQGLPVLHEGSAGNWELIASCSVGHVDAPADGVLALGGPMAGWCAHALGGGGGTLNWDGGTEVTIEEVGMEVDGAHVTITGEHDHLGLGTIGVVTAIGTHQGGAECMSGTADTFAVNLVGALE